MFWDQCIFFFKLCALQAIKPFSSETGLSRLGFIPVIKFLLSVKYTGNIFYKVPCMHLPTSLWISKRLPTEPNYPYRPLLVMICLANEVPTAYEILYL